ncbi:MAG: hypothetical protein K0R24_1480 [Gammaproteobacteria bacterium]|jgi:hypothetical protein|nr:hypothetical protein [Gammaproteobacteria bacterium]MCE3238499.1 hypothetical protein [Gammaproteobacteria bacterium]
MAFGFLLSELYLMLGADVQENIETIRMICGCSFYSVITFVKMMRATLFEINPLLEIGIF